MTGGIERSALEIIAGVSKGLGGLGGMEELPVYLRESLRSLMGVGGFAKGVLYLAREGDENQAMALQVAACHGIPEPQRAGSAEILGLVATSMRTKRPLFYSPLEGPGCVLPQALDAAGAFLLPLVTESEPTGALVLADWSEPLNQAHWLAMGPLLSHQLGQLITLRRALSAQTASYTRCRMMMDSVRDAITVLAPEGTILDVNRAGEAIFGLSRDKLIGSHVSEYAPEGRTHVHMNEYEEALKQGRTSTPVPIRRADGTVVSVDFTLSTLKIDGKALVVSVGRDVTERVLAEEALRKSQEQLYLAQKMEAVGQLTGGIAHDFNNLLTAILINAEFLLAHIGETDPRREDVQEIKLASERAASLTRQLLAFSRRQVLEPSIVDLNAVVAGIRKMLVRLIGEDLTLETKPGPDLGSVKADPGQIEQVIMNLAVNARDAMPKGGRLTIATEQVQIDEPTALRTHVACGDYIMLSVADTGAGMDDEVQKHIFEPFFTTKEKGKGTGLGLSTCYGIVRQSGGYILVDSEVGRGSVFKIYLPRVDEPPRTRSRQAAPRPQTGSETIVLLEDEERVRAAIRRILETRGYRVLIPGNGQEAIDLCSGMQRIDLIVSDVIMPGLGGPELVRRLRSRSVQTPVLFVSGYTDDRICPEDLTLATGFLQKPFTPELLTKKVREVLDGHC